MFVKRTTYNAMKREKDDYIARLEAKLATLDRALAAAQSDIDDNNEALAKKLAATRDALADIINQATKRPNATVLRMVAIASEALQASNDSQA